MDVNQKYCQSCHLISRNRFIIRKIMSLQICMLLVYGQCYHVIRMQLRRPETRQNDFRKDTILDHVSDINLVQRRNRKDWTQNFRKQ
jgi:hypothetical protein